MQQSKGKSSGWAPAQMGKGYGVGLSQDKGRSHGVQGDMMAALHTLLTLVGNAGPVAMQGRGWASESWGQGA